MSDTMERAKDLTDQYERGLMPSAEESERLDYFFKEIDILDAKMDSGEISVDEFATAVKDLREKSKLSALRTLGSPAVSSVKNQNFFANSAEATDTLMSTTHTEDDPQDSSYKGPKSMPKIRAVIK